MKSERLTDAQVRALGWEALVEKLGPTGALRFSIQTQGCQSATMSSGGSARSARSPSTNCWPACGLRRRRPGRARVASSGDGEAGGGSSVDATSGIGDMQGAADRPANPALDLGLSSPPDFPLSAFGFELSSPPFVRDDAQVISLGGPARPE